MEQQKNVEQKKNNEMDDTMTSKNDTVTSKNDTVHDKITGGKVKR